MHIHEVTAVAGRVGPKRKRIGRGIGSHGKTSGRGHKGESSRSGAKGYLFKEGGQMPLFRKIAKRGFSAGDYSAQKRIAIVNVGALVKLDASVSLVDAESLITAGLIPRRSQVVRVLGGGDLKRALTVEANHVSRSAVQKIEAAGGKVVLR
jgi:large subunit ribosomal protein L15